MILNIIYVKYKLDSAIATKYGRWVINLYRKLSHKKPISNTNLASLLRLLSVLTLGVLILAGILQENVKDKRL